MAKPKYQLSAHAATVIAERQIQVEWLERVLQRPERTEPGKFDSRLTHALGRISERGDRVLRVVYNGNLDPLRIVIVYFDRGQRGRP